MNCTCQKRKMTVSKYDSNQNNKPKATFIFYLTGNLLSSIGGKKVTLVNETF